MLRRGWIVVAAVALSTAAAGLVSRSMETVWTSQSVVAVSSLTTGEGAGDGPRIVQPVDPRYADGAARLARTYAAMIPESQVIAERVGDEIGWSAERVRENVQVTAEPETAVLTIAFTAPGATTARRGAAAVTEALLAERTLGDGRATVRTEGLGLVRPADRARRSAGVGDAAIPAGAILGLLLGLMLALAWHRADRRADDPGTAADELGVPVSRLDELSAPAVDALLARLTTSANGNGNGRRRRGEVLLLGTRSTPRSALARSAAALSDGHDVVNGGPVGPQALEHLARRPAAIVLAATPNQPLRVIERSIRDLAKLGAEPGWVILARRGGPLRG